MSIGSFALYPLTFYELQPVYLCKSIGSGDEWETCKAEDFCDQPDIEYKIDKDNAMSLDNWVEEYGMTCSPKYQFGLFGSCFFIAVVVSSLIFTPLADKIGRRTVLLIGLAMACLAQTILLFSTSRVFTYVLIFIIGLAMPPRVFVGYIYAMEFLPIDKSQSTTGFIMGNDGLVPCIASLWFMFLSKDWKTLFTVATVILYIVLIFVITMPESPKFLLAQGKYAEARVVMTRIARHNKAKTLAFTEKEKAIFVGSPAGTGEAVDDKAVIEYNCKWEQEVEKSAKQVNNNQNNIQIDALDTIEDVVRQGSPELRIKATKLGEKVKKDTSEMDSKSFKKFLRSCLNLTNLVAFVYLFSVASFDYYLINFYLKYIPGNVFINMIVSSVSSSISGYLSGVIVLKLGAQNGMCVTFGLCFISSILLMAAESSLWLSVIPFAVLAAQFGVSSAFGMLYMCTLQYFPSHLLGTIFGVCNVTARAVTIMSPMVAEAAPPTPVLMIILSCLGAVIATRFLKVPDFLNKVDENKVDKALEHRNKATLELKDTKTKNQRAQTQQKVVKGQQSSEQLNQDGSQRSSRLVKIDLSKITSKILKTKFDTYSCIFGGASAAIQSSSNPLMMMQQTQQPLQQPPHQQQVPRSDSPYF